MIEMDAASTPINSIEMQLNWHYLGPYILMMIPLEYDHDSRVWFTQITAWEAQQPHKMLVPTSLPCPFID
jgi:hypothetical protein